MPATRNFRVNGQVATVVVDDLAAPLLYVLRNDLGLHGPRFGCGLGQCGACTIHLNGEAVRSCTRPVSTIRPEDEITTLEGLGTREHPHALQIAFIDEQAVQCGYCINGMIMQAAAYLTNNPKPTIGEIKNALQNNLCRCGTHLRIIRAVMRASEA